MSLLKSDIPELEDKDINIDDKVSKEIECNFKIEKLLGLGGSGTVFKAKVINDTKNLKSETTVALKLCNSMLTYYGCILLKDEAEYTNTFSVLNYKNICYNYPIIYGFYHRCLFFTNTQLEEIFEYMENNGINKGKDCFLLYCTTPKYIDINEIDDSIVNYVFKNFDTDLLLKSREILPKTENILGLYYLSKRDQTDIDWGNNSELYDYLELQQDLKCDMFLLMQYLNGKTLLEIKQINNNFKFTDNLFFEYMYSTIVRVFYIKKNQVDIQESNAMIVNTNVPRIYHYEDKYYIIKGDIFYWIDIANLNDVHQVVKSEFKYQNFYTPNQILLLNHLFNDKEEISVKFFINKLFKWISDKVPVMNEEDISKYIVFNYNYRYIDPSKIL
jgi:serine/threonine protein kinase